MFTRKIKFAGDCVIKWFNKSTKLKNLELSIGIKKNMRLRTRLTGN